MRGIHACSEVHTSKLLAWWSGRGGREAETCWRSATYGKKVGRIFNSFEGSGWREKLRRCMDVSQLLLLTEWFAIAWRTACTTRLLVVLGGEPYLMFVRGGSMGPIGDIGIQHHDMENDVGKS